MEVETSENLGNENVWSPKSFPKMIDGVKCMQLYMCSHNNLQKQETKLPFSHMISQEKWI